MTVELYCGDCLEIMPTLPQVDAIITDLPYGTTACSWDTVIPFEPMWAQVKRVCKGVFVTTASQPFTSLLITSNLDWFKYEWIWNKIRPGNIFIAKQQPLKIHENIIVFGKGKYIPQKIKLTGYIRDRRKEKEITNIHNGAVSPIGVRKYADDYDPSEKYPVSIQVYPNKNQGDSVYHPTQKPIALYEYLIRTYTNEGDTVLDICAGSGTTGVACVNTNRNFIGIELREDYFKIMQDRIKDAQAQMRLPL